VIVGDESQMRRSSTCRLARSLWILPRTSSRFMALMRTRMGQGQVPTPIAPSCDAALHSSRAMILGSAQWRPTAQVPTNWPRRRASASRRCSSTSSQCDQIHGSRRSVRDGKTESGQCAVNVTTMLRPIENLICFMGLLSRSIHESGDFTIWVNRCRSTQLPRCQILVCRGCQL
jgi:hypothetical protein